MKRILLLFFTIPFFCAFATTPDGIYKVVKIENIPNTIITNRVKFDDPVYNLNRIFIFSPSKIKTDFEFINTITECASPIWNNINKRTYKLTCGDFLRNSEFLIESSSQIIITVNDYMYQFKLYLEKINHISPSFSCKKTKTLSEKLICKNIFLSGLDLSLHEAFLKAKEFISMSGGNNASLIQNQRDFLKKRNACKTEDCLQAIMGNQLFFLRDNISRITPY